MLSLAFALHVQAATVSFLPDTIVPRQFRDALRAEINDKCFKTDLMLEELESLTDFQEVVDGVWTKLYATKFVATYKENGTTVTEKFVMVRGDQSFTVRYGYSQKITSRIYWNEDKVCRD